VYFVYIIQCKDGSFYTGMTTDVERRFIEHKTGKGGRYTRSHLPLKVVYTEKCKDRSSALKREDEIKRWRRAKKVALIK